MDVREADEYEIEKVEGVPLLPLSQLRQRFTKLAPKAQYYIHCKAGMRSLNAPNHLWQPGFKYLRSVERGIGDYSHDIDPSVAKR